MYSIDRFGPALKGQIQHLEIMAISLMIMMSLVVMLFWGLMGVFGGLASFLIALIFLYRPLTDLNPYYYSILIIAFFLNSFIGYYIFRKINVSNQGYTVATEKIGEDINLLSNHMKSRVAEITAMGEKVNSLLKLKKIADTLSMPLTGEEIIKFVSEETFGIFGGDNRVLLFMIDKARNELNLVHMSKGEGRAVFATKKGSVFDKWVLKNMKSILVKNVKKDFRFSVGDEEMKDDSTSLIIKPLIVEGNVLGMLRIDSPRDSAFGQHELRILDIIGELAAVAIENARLYSQTEELAIKDSLTGLYVHRYFMERLEEEVKRALRSDSCFTLLMLDIDNFKDFNDEYGHISGDAILKNIGRILKSKSSAGDIVARYGGEEFAFLALKCGKKEAVKLAESIREQIQNSPVVLRRKKCSVTVSIGIAIFPVDARLSKDIIWEADRCLYEAKAKGKNRICSK
ncbi:MAG: sensor domain-containing diguanylate cyclase [Candidatus Omnitrophota bacterium]|nr:sensor domain-containing diguanylate cyclase [Candidatus Omnitrophota bacterium]